MITSIGGEPLRGIFPQSNDPINIEPQTIIGALVTSFVSTEENDKFPVFSVSEISKLVELLN